MNIPQQLKQVERKIEKLEFDLAVEKAVYERLRDIDTGNQLSLFRDSQTQTTPGSMPSHIEAVLTAAGKPMTVNAIIEAVTGRGASGVSKDALKNNVRGTLKRRIDLFVRHDRGVYRLKQPESGTEIEQG